MMVLSTLIIVQAILAAALSASASLIVNVAPTTPQPYVLPNLKGSAIDFGGLIVRTVVPNTTSNGTFSLLSVNSGPAALNLIHYHKEVEAFYTLKGSVQVFHNADQGREVRANDFALLAPRNNHTYRPNDLDFQLMLCMAPGGIDQFFAAAGDPYTADAPFNPEDKSQLDVPKVLSLMPKYNIVPNPFNPINMDWTNGTTADGLDTWHVADQTFPNDTSKPYFISSNRGPKYLFRGSGQVIAQLTSGQQTNDKLSVATVALGPHSNKTKASSADVHQALQVTEGQLHLRIGREVAQLIFGDLAFIPAGTAFQYWSTAGFTKFINWSAGAGKGLADTLIAKSEPWEYAVWPVEQGGYNGKNRFLTNN